MCSLVRLVGRLKGADVVVVVVVVVIVISIVTVFTVFFTAVVRPSVACAACLLACWLVL